MIATPTGRAEQRRKDAQRQQPTTQEDFILRLRQSAPEWVWGCDRCDMGYIGLPCDALEMERGQKFKEYLAGLLTLCDCKAGQMNAVSFRKQAEEQDLWPAQIKAMAEQAQQRRLARLFEAAHIPERYANLDFRTYVRHADQGKHEAVRIIKEYYASGFVDVGGGRRYGILLYGTTDQGKTGCLSPLFKHFVQQGNSGLWVQYNDLMAALKDFGSGQVEERIQACKQVEYLMVDDLGDPAADKAATDYARDVLFRIIDHRNNYRKPTFITSNLHPDHMAGQFHDRMAKRLQELCVIVEVKGRPMRELLRGIT